MSEAVHGPPPVIDMTHHRSLMDSEVINMIAQRPAATPGHDQGGQDVIDEGDEEAPNAAAANQADYDTLVSSLRQRISELEASVASSAQRNPFQTPTVPLVAARPVSRRPL